MRGNWPLVPTMDVVVPHTRTMADMFEVLDVVVANDPETRGDLWRAQPWIVIPRASAVRPKSYPALLPDGVESARKVLAGKRFGIPRMYVNADAEAGVGENLGIGGSTGRRIQTRQSVLDLFQAAGGRADRRRRRGGAGGLPGGVQLRTRPRERPVDQDPRIRQPGVPAP